MEIVIIAVFILGYFGIAFEHTVKVDKLIPALGMMAILWALISVNHMDVFEIIPGVGKESHHIENVLLHHLGKTAEILFFLMGAMTIVEIIDYFDGFSTIKTFIKTKSKTKLLWLFTTLAFVLSAIIDNLTATIVLITILQKIIKEREIRLWFAGLIVIAANAGGAWSPIGDVTTTMLWIANKVTPVQLLAHVLLPSIACYVIPSLIASKLKIFKGYIDSGLSEDNSPKSKYGTAIFYIGLAGILFVPIFKTFTHLPPYVGMVLSLAIISAIAEYLSNNEFSIAGATSGHGVNDPQHSPVHKSLSKIEMPSILFFLGILMAVAALESLGMLYEFAGVLEKAVPMLGTEHGTTVLSDLVILLLGAGSAVIDNVPLVAASIGMFSMGLDAPEWHFIAYSAGTGGSILVIGSAAGVVAMGMEKIDFFWYLKKIGGLAILGYLSGSVIFILLRDFLLNTH